MGRLLAILAIVFFTGAAHASDDQGRFVSIGAGKDSCGAYTASRTREADTAFVIWLGGYLTAFNMTHAVYDILGSTDVDGALGWLDNFCKANPTVTFSNASGALVVFLLPTARRTAPPR